MSVSYFYAQNNEPDSIPYTIEDKNGYMKFIDDLRKKLCGKIKDSNCIKYDGKDMEGNARKLQKSILPAQQHGEQPNQWINIDIELKDTEGKVTSKTALVIRNDSLYVKGFKNQNGEWFEICGPEENGKEKLPGKNYMAEELVGWEVAYRPLMGLNHSWQVKSTLMTARLGKDFAERAVRRLSSYPKTEYNDDMPVRLGLAGLIVMICEAARMVPFFEHFAGSTKNNYEGGAWDQGKGLEDKKNMFTFLWNWGNMSAALLKRKNNPYCPWDSGCDVNSEQAIECVHLVLYTSYELNRSGGAHVEILDVSVSANFRVNEIRFIDEAQQIKPIIYTHKDWKNEGDNKDTDKDKQKGSMENDLSDTKKSGKPEVLDLLGENETNKFDTATVQEDNKEKDTDKDKQKGSMETDLSDTKKSSKPEVLDLLGENETNKFDTATVQEHKV